MPTQPMTQTTDIQPQAAPQEDANALITLAGIKPRTIAEAMQVCKTVADSGIVPKAYQGNAAAVFTAGVLGARVGWDIVTSCQNIAAINGKPSIYGDAPLGLVMASGLLEEFEETDDGKTATCRVKRRGREALTWTFSMDDARVAKLIDKDGPWRQYPKRMRQFRARSFALRDTFPDVLMGFRIAEEYEGVDEHRGPDKAKPVDATVERPKGATARLKAKATPKTPVQASPPEPTPEEGDAGSGGAESTDPPPSDIDTVIQDFRQEILHAKDGDALREIGDRIQASTAEVQAKVRENYRQKGNVLAAQAKKAAEKDREPGGEG